ncbi:hypothetical protein SAY87_014152 [Trapa incisa]|uniref:NADH dehydrogenase [ubiquinone] 1 beta subcomplex subunit 3 n=1 Tax=Trapa incisa TaxID=236973 RepID=A0AAN7GJI8_9MYRT|nr:hypothetical protein SAY87_014152 [Trapa incisa]
MAKPMGPTGEFFKRRDEWRKRPMLMNQPRHATPNLGIALVAFGIYLVGEHSDEHHRPTSLCLTDNEAQSPREDKSLELAGSFSILYLNSPLDCKQALQSSLASSSLCTHTDSHSHDDAKLGGFFHRRVGGATDGCSI